MVSAACRITNLMYPPNSPLYSWWTLRAMKKVQSTPEHNLEIKTAEEVPDTWVIPVIQSAHFHIRQDEICTLKCLEATEPGGNLQLASAYLNLVLLISTQHMAWCTSVVNCCIRTIQA